MDTELDHCRHDPAHCLTPGLFRNFTPGSRDNEKLNVTYEHNGIRLQFVAANALGADDLRFLQGMVAMAGLHGFKLRPEATKELAIRLRDLLGISKGEPDASSVPCASHSPKKADTSIMVTFKTRKLLQELGMATGGSNVMSFRASLKRMSNVTVYVSKGEGNDISEKSCHLLSYESSKSMANVSVALNPILAATILGSSKNFTRIDFAEIRKLKSDSARLIHQRLCAQIRMGGTQKVSQDKLVSYVWGDCEHMSATYRKRVGRIRESLNDFSHIGWTVKLVRKGLYQFKRPAWRKAN